MKPAKVRGLNFDWLISRFLPRSRRWTRSKITRLLRDVVFCCAVIGDSTRITHYLFFSVISYLYNLNFPRNSHRGRPDKVTCSARLFHECRIIPFYYHEQTTFCSFVTQIENRLMRQDVTFLGYLALP